jgi:malonate decarboxylase epsilon subunit
MKKVLEAARKSGARKAVLSEPSHCPLLQPVADTLTKSLHALHLHEPKLIYVGNVTGRVLRTEEAISKDLATNIVHGVRWYDNGPDGIGLSPVSRDASRPCSN